MTMIGTETVLNIEALRRHYDALSSFLHVPTLKQTKSGKGHDQGKVRMRCTEVAEYIDKVLTSPVHNVTLGIFATIDCAECSKSIRKRIPATVETVESECFSIAFAHPRSTRPPFRPSLVQASLQRKLPAKWGSRALNCGFR